MGVNIAQISSPLQSYPDLNNLTELEIDEFLDMRNFRESIRIKIKEAKEVLDKGLEKFPGEKDKWGALLEKLN